MYKIFCKKCGHNNYSASRRGKWICCHCGEELKTSTGEGDKKNKKFEKLA